MQTDVMADGLLDAVAAPVFVLDVEPSGRIVYSGYNRTALAIAGFALADVLGRTVEEVFAGRMGQVAYARHQQVARSAETSVYEVDLPMADRVRHMRTTMTPLLDAQGKVTRLVGTFTDITAENVINQARAGAEVLSTEIEEFISLAAHDLRSPIRRVQAIAGMLRADFEDLGDGKLELIDMLEKVAVKTSELIVDVLEHARATGLQEEERQEFDFGDLCADLSVMLDPLGEHAINHPGGSVAADRAALQIVLRNLMDNALKHSGRERVELEISLGAASPDMLEVSVTDNGKGFAKPALDLLAGGKLRPDSGFGLAGIRRLVASRGGHIEIEAADEAHGARVRATLPGRILAGG